MKGYQRNSDSFNQLLIKLDELGVKALFINHLVDKTVKSKSIDVVRKSTDKPHRILSRSLLWKSTPEDFRFWHNIKLKVIEVEYE